MSSPSRFAGTGAHTAPTRFERSGPLKLVGIRRRFTEATRDQIPQLWHEVGPHFGKIPNQSGDVGYGVCFSGPADGEIEYMAAAGVSDVGELPTGWTRVALPAQRYAVFPHEGPASEISATVKEIFEGWLPASGNKEAVANSNRLEFIEHYGEGYNPQTGKGDIEIWVPVGG